MEDLTSVPPRLCDFIAVKCTRASIQASLWVFKRCAFLLKCTFPMKPLTNHTETKPKPSKTNPPYLAHIFISYTLIYDEMQKRHQKQKNTKPSETNPNQPPNQPPEPPYVTHTVHSRTQIKASTLTNIILNKRVDAPKRVCLFSIIGGGRRATERSAQERSTAEQSGAQRKRSGAKCSRVKRSAA